MDVSVQIIPLANLAYSFIPVLLVIALLVKWSLEAGNAVYSLARMVLQLILVGYVLVFIFDSNDFWITSAVIVMMIFVSSWIALRTLKKLRWQLYSLTVFSTFIGGGSVLIITVWPR